MNLGAAIALCISLITTNYGWEDHRLAQCRYRIHPQIYVFFVILSLFWRTFFLLRRLVWFNYFPILNL